MKNVNEICGAEMLKESYLANVRNLPKDAIKITVTRRAGHILSPSKNLLKDYKDGSINWEQYVERFKREMNNDECIAAMRKIKWMAKDKQVYLICYEKDPYRCHRSLLLDMISKLDED